MEKMIILTVEGKTKEFQRETFDEICQLFNEYSSIWKLDGVKIKRITVNPK